MRIEKIINNNVVSSLDEDGHEIIVMGRGIGFAKKQGAMLDMNKIDKIFRMQDEDSIEKMKLLLKRLPLEYVQVSNEIIAYAKNEMNLDLSENVFLTLTDHIGFALERFKEGMLFQNALVNEIRRFYPIEYSVGKHALDLIYAKTGVKLPGDEAASIAIHLVNAEFNIKVRDTWVLTNMISSIMQEIASLIPDVEDESLEKDMLLSELKFLAYRTFVMRPKKDEADAALTKFVKENLPEEYALSERVAAAIGKEYNCDVSEEEIVYLALHVRRIRDLHR